LISKADKTAIALPSPCLNIPNKRCSVPIKSCPNRKVSSLLKPITSFTFDEKYKEGDSAVDKNGVRLVVDPMSYQYLIGSTVDYLEDLQGSRFIIHNPNAKTTCGCGSSFSV